MSSASFIISGPEEDYDIPKTSFGKYLFNCLKKQNNNHELIVDAITKEVLTSGKLLEDSIKFTAVLKKLSIGKGDVIAIVCENTLNYFIPVLSALYMGATFCPLNPSYLADELKHAFLTFKPKLVICSERTIKYVLAAKEQLEFIETVLLLMGAQSENHPEVRNLEQLIQNVEMDTDNYTPEEVNHQEEGACILLSSGTTGLPKGVLLTHDSIGCCGYLQKDAYFNLTSNDTTLLVLPYFHIFGLYVQWISIIACAKVVLLDKFKPDAFLQTIQDYKITKLYMVPPLVLFLGKSPLVSKYDMSSIKEILCGAAPLGKDIQDETIERLKIPNVRQVYGFTEAGGPCTFTGANAKPGSVGLLIPKIQAKVRSLDSGKSVGPYEIGELCFKGQMVMKGYVGNILETENSFDEDGFLHSGDLGYYDEENYMYIVDRVKEMIKYKGFQVAPAELEDLILSHPGVKECGVIGIADERAGQLPLAFVVKQSGVDVTEQEIMAFVAERISVQKHLYGGVRFIDEIPKTASGKILRRKLKEMYENNYES